MSSRNSLGTCCGLSSDLIFMRKCSWNGSKDLQNQIPYKEETNATYKGTFKTYCQLCNIIHILHSFCLNTISKLELQVGIYISKGIVDFELIFVRGLWLRNNKFFPRIVDRRHPIILSWNQVKITSSGFPMFFRG